MMYTSAMDSKRPFVGHIADQWMRSCPEARVQGVTSSGIFIQLHDYQIIFLTESPDFGPINIILNQRLPDKWQLQDKLQIEYGPEEIKLVHNSGQLRLTQYEIWSPPPAPPILISKDEQLKRVKLSVSQIYTIKGDNGFSAYLSSLLKPKSYQATVDATLQHLLDIRASLQTLESGLFLNHTKAITGSGRGLTPSGDDLICGILFVLNRWKFKHVPAKWVQEINQELFNYVRERTTSASISLIYCAIQGSADYRIQQLTDALVNEKIPFQQQAMQLARWGSSSGADIFAGILIAIQSIFDLFESETSNAKNQLPGMRE